MFSDDELIYLYRQGNDWAFRLLQSKCTKIIYKEMAEYKKLMVNYGYDEADCFSRCQYCFYKCVHYYCGTKNAQFLTYFVMKVRYTLKDYQIEMAKKWKKGELYLPLDQFEEIGDPTFEPKRLFDFQLYYEDLLEIREKTKGIEGEVAGLLMEGYDASDISEILPYDIKSIHNALYRIRKKLRIIEQ